jgi:hypothetical protein
MSTVAIVGFNEPEESDLKRLLQIRGHRVLNWQQQNHPGRAETTEIIIVQVFEPVPDFIGYLKRLGITDVAAQIVLVVCPRFNGAQFELKCERRGMRVVYA